MTDALEMAVIVLAAFILPGILAALAYIAGRAIFRLWERRQLSRQFDDLTKGL